MRIRKLDKVFQGRAEGRCCGLPYDTELASSQGVSILFWCGDSFDDVLLQKALFAARNSRDVICAVASLGAPEKFWANSDIGVQS